MYTPEYACSTNEHAARLLYIHVSMIVSYIIYLKTQIEEFKVFSSRMAAKLKDGLFIGDADTSMDPEFLDLNKISNLINTSAPSIKNVWSSHGIRPF